MTHTRNQIKSAVRVVHQQRDLQGQLWRFDSPTEAALVAQLWTGRRAEEVVESVGNPQPEQTDFQFAHLGPKYLQSDEQRHAYVLGQHHFFCAHTMADERGWLKKNTQQLGQEQQQQQPEPCSPKASPAAAAAAAGAASSGAACSTPVAQLRATQAQVADVSPMNNRIRRMAAEIMEGSSALQETLEEHSRCARRSSASIRSRASTHSDGSGEGSGTVFMASPGRAWQPCPDTQLQDGELPGLPRVWMVSDSGASLFEEPTFGRISSNSSTAGAHSTDQQHELPCDLPARAAAASSEPECTTAAEAEAAAHVASSASAACRSAAAGPIAVLTLDSSAAALERTQALSTSNDSLSPKRQERCDSRLSNRSSNGGIKRPSDTCVSAQQAASPGAEDSWHAEGFWSCDDDDDEEEEEQEGEEHQQQQLASQAFSAAGPCFYTCDGGVGEPCQLPLSPQLLRQLSKQLSGMEAGAGAELQAPGLDRSVNGDAAAGCDWVTVCSFDGAE